MVFGFGRGYAEGAVVCEQAPDDTCDLVCDDDECIDVRVVLFAFFLIETLEGPDVPVEGEGGQIEGLA